MPSTMTVGKVIEACFARDHVLIHADDDRFRSCLIDKDFLNGPVDEIRDAEALLTVVGGKVVFRSPRMLN